MDNHYSFKLNLLPYLESDKTVLLIGDISEYRELCNSLGVKIQELTFSIFLLGDGDEPFCIAIENTKQIHLCKRPRW